MFIVRKLIILNCGFSTKVIFFAEIKETFNLDTAFYEFSFLPIGTRGFS